MNRIVVTALFFASALVFNVGCQKIDSSEPEKPEDRVITNIRQLGSFKSVADIEGKLGISCMKFAMAMS